MGFYINTGNEGFRSSRNSEYVDKSGLIGVVNGTLFTRQRFTCVSRCRRFGKSMAAEMLAAYYDKSCDSRKLFADLKIAGHPSFEKHLNKYPVIYLDMTDFITRFQDDEIVKAINAAILKDVKSSYPDVPGEPDDDLMEMLMRVAAATGERFIFIIDEWDAVYREFPLESPSTKLYVDWLRRMFKSNRANDVFAGVYMTGILPIKKYKTQSALNNFEEYSVVTPGSMASFFGFTKDEVRALSEKYNADFEELEKWYDGYRIGGEPSIFNPNSVMKALRNHMCESYWGTTASYDAIVPYITMNFDGLKDDIIAMVAGERRPVDPSGFQNDLSVVRSRDDVLTVLIHLGYLSYDGSLRECFIPNKEVRDEMERAVKAAKWPRVTEALENSRKLLQATLAGDAAAVAAGLERAHDENTSILSYNDENSLACVVSIAYLAAKDNYIIHRELAGGKGFADLVFIPRKNISLPAMVIELKCDVSAQAAIDQIKRKNYPAKVAEYAGDILLVGINYDKISKLHHCKIERIRI